MDTMEDMLGSELGSLKDKIDKLESENAKLKLIIKDNDLEDEIEGIDLTSIEEQICINGIKHIADRVKFDDFDQNDIKNFDVLLKALRVVRGQSNPKESKKKFDIKDALKIVEGF